VICVLKSVMATWPYIFSSAFFRNTCATIFPVLSFLFLCVPNFVLFVCT
jgi:hypothetical protein